MAEFSAANLALSTAWRRLEIKDFAACDAASHECALWDSAMHSWHTTYIKKTKCVERIGQCSVYQDFHSLLISFLVSNACL